jgi:hypothetical protein
MLKKMQRIMVLLFLMPAICQAAVIEIGFTGLVDNVVDPYNLLENGVQEGASISGFYIYDSETPDSEPEGLTYIGWYRQTTAPSIMCLTADSLTFQSDPTNMDIMIAVSNNYGGAILDVYGVTSYNNLELDNGIIVDAFGMGFDDYSGTALSSDALPTIPLDLSQWESNGLGIQGSGYPTPPIGGDKSAPFSIYGHVTSVWLIPEPTTLLLFSFGALILRKRKRN